MSNSQTNKKSELRRSKAKLFRDCTRFNKVPRVPNLGNIGTWRVLDAGYNLSDAFNDYVIMEKCITRFLNIYPVDALVDFGLRNPFKVIETFGRGSYYYNDSNGVVGMKPMELCTHEELKQLVKDPIKFMWEVVMPRKYKDFDRKTILDWQRTLDAEIKKNEYTAHINELMENEYQLPLIAPIRYGNPAVGVEMLFSVFRGIKGFSYDINKDAQLVIDCIEKLNESQWDPGVQRFENDFDGMDANYCFDISLMMLAQAVISPKQFEIFYFPYIKKLLDIAVKKGKTVRILIEGNSAPFLEYFNDYPKGTIAVNIENDNLTEIRKRYQNLALIGGMKTTMLSISSSKKCIEIAKKLIDELGEGYIFSTDKFVFYKQDAKAENLRDVFRFVRNYRI